MLYRKFLFICSSNCFFPQEPEKKIAQNKNQIKKKIILT
jgi:hypothetical protein